ncbi:glycosyltransferase family 2 protein [Pararhizobium sp. BT-229]|uniref:glycosyltransferase family 2 protein n=1 Tax=Pararhizobium sp. BT-229 TaxID=2986923 RepID=UPI0021F6B598|nr:glycosyltransferase family 2 protein [Pararhizobium sp. BT-229]MCV9967685.1 glycosyltransferase family 2 protein [Pararhizobium sp. BT-229]
MDASTKQREPLNDNRIAPEPADARKLSIVTVTYNSASVLSGLLDSLRAGLEGIEQYEVIVVDNDSHDHSVDLALAHPIGARVIRTGRNGGYSAGINAATATMDPSADLLVLNPDIRLRPGSISRLYAGLSNSSVGVAVPQVRGEDGAVAKSIRREPSIVTAWSEALLGGTKAARMGLGEIVDRPSLYRDGGPIEWATGAILLVSARAREVIGDWDESFFLYSEEVDYLQRARAAGLDVLYVPTSQAVHIGGDYHSSDVLTALMTANRIKYYRRHHGALASVLFRSGIVVGEVMRLAIGTGRRSALGAALGRWSGR